MRVLVGGIGYRQLCDYSFGVALTDALAQRAWPDGVSVEDISYNPIAVVQRFEDDPPDRRFALAIVIGAAQRPGRVPGTLAVYRWDNALPAPDLIQRAVADAVTGVISLDNTLVVARHFGPLAPQVIVVEVEPLVHAFGETFSDPVREAFDHALATVARLALDPGRAGLIPKAPLGGAYLRADALQVGLL